MDTVTTAALKKYADECREWNEIAEELERAGRHPSAFDISEEQRRRMLARDERPITYEELIAPDSN
jgi:hypothetical protein